MCPLPTSYNWSFFILDAAFYATIGYGIVLLYKRLERNQQDHLVDPDKTTKQ
jgi:hypothetical protein